MLSTQAQFNSHCADALLASNPLRRRSMLPYCDDCPRRFGNRNRNSVSAGARNKPFASLFVSRRRKTFAPVNKGRLGARLGSNSLARWRNDCLHAEKPNNVREFWSVKPQGTDLKKLDAAPDWYARTKSSPYFTNVEPETESSPGPGASPESSESPNESPTPAPSYKSPDGAFELVLREDPNDEADQVNMPGHGAHYVLRDLKSGTDAPFADLNGFEGAFEILHEKQNPERHFLFDGTLRLAFFDLHLNSSDGTTVFALDLGRKRFVRLSPNWATPFPLPGESALLTFTENRYVPIPKSTKTANCWYVERWDENLRHIRYARENTAAICYGFSMYRPGKNPAVIALSRTSESEE
jgi:hypothetical protein